MARGYLSRPGSPCCPHLTLGGGNFESSRCPLTDSISEQNRSTEKPNAALVTGALTGALALSSLLTLPFWAGFPIFNSPLCLFSVSDWLLVNQVGEFLVCCPRVGCLASKSIKVPLYLRFFFSLQKVSMILTRRST